MIPDYNFDQTTLIIASISAFLLLSFLAQILMRRNTLGGSKPSGLSTRFAKVKFSVEGLPFDVFSGHLRSLSSDSLSLVVKGEAFHKGAELNIDISDLKGHLQNTLQGRVIKSSKFDRSRNNYLLQVKLTSDIARKSIKPSPIR